MNEGVWYQVACCGGFKVSRFLASDYYYCYYYYYYYCLIILANYSSTMTHFCRSIIAKCVLTTRSDSFSACACTGAIYLSIISLSVVSNVNRSSCVVFA